MSATEDVGPSADSDGDGSSGVDLGESVAAFRTAPSDVKEFSENLTVKKAVLLLQTFTQRLDLFQDTTHLSPSRYPRSKLGGLVSLVVVCGVLITVGGSLLELLKFDRVVIRRSEYSILNAMYFAGDDEKDLHVSREADVPSLMLTLSCRLIQFQSTAETVAPTQVDTVTVTDNFGYEKQLSSRVENGSMSQSIAAYNERTVPLNSWDERLMQMPSTARSTETLSELRGLSFVPNANSAHDVLAQFSAMKKRRSFAHHAYLYVGFDAVQLRGLKSCQLQVPQNTVTLHLHSLPEHDGWDRVRQALSECRSCSRTVRCSGRRGCAPH